MVPYCFAQGIFILIGSLLLVKKNIFFISHMIAFTVHVRPLTAKNLGSIMPFDVPCNPKITFFFFVLIS